jgi:hypothetical protein
VDGFSSSWEPTGSKNFELDAAALGAKSLFNRAFKMQHARQAIRKGYRASTLG